MRLTPVKREFNKLPEYEVLRLHFDNDDDDTVTGGSRRLVASFRVYTRNTKMQGPVVAILKSVIDDTDGEILRLTQIEEAEIVDFAMRALDEEHEFRTW